MTTIKDGLTSEIDEDELTDVETVDKDRKNALNAIFGRTTTAVSFGQISVRNLIVEGLALWVPMADDPVRVGLVTDDVAFSVLVAGKIVQIGCLRFRRFRDFLV